SFDRPQVGESVRVRVARAALQAALAMPGVLGSDSGPSRGRVTADPASGPLIGVLGTAQSDGRSAVDLSLVADMVPLPALAEEVRARVCRRVDAEELGVVAVIAGEAGEVGARGSGSVTGEARGRVAAPSSAGIGVEGERRLA